MPRTLIVHLSPNGTYNTTSAYSDPEWPNHVFTRNGKHRQAFSLQSNPSFLVEERILFMGFKPERFETWQEFIDSEPSLPSLGTNTRLIVADANYQDPYSCNERLTLEQMHALGAVHYEEMIQSAAGKASREELGSGARRVAFLMFSTATLLLAVVLGLLIGVERFS